MMTYVYALWSSGFGFAIIKDIVIIIIIMCALQAWQACGASGPGPGRGPGPGPGLQAQPAVLEEAFDSFNITGQPHRVGLRSASQCIMACMLMNMGLQRERERNITSCQPTRADWMFCIIHTGVQKLLDHSTLLSIPISHDGLRTFKRGEEPKSVKIYRLPTLGLYLLRTTGSKC